MNLDNLYPKYRCGVCDDWFHMPFKYCQCERKGMFKKLGNLADTVKKVGNATKQASDVVNQASEITKQVGDVSKQAKKIDAKQAAHLAKEGSKAAFSFAITEVFSKFFGMLKIQILLPVLFFSGFTGLLGVLVGYWIWG